MRARVIAFPLACSMTECRWTAEQLEHFADIVTAAWRLNGPGGAYPATVARQLPPDLDLEELRPILESRGVPMSAPPVEDPKYVGLQTLTR